MQIMLEEKLSMRWEINSYFRFRKHSNLKILNSLLYVFFLILVKIKGINGTLAVYDLLSFQRKKKERGVFNMQSGTRV